MLTGRSASSQDYLSFYDYSLSVISNDIKREFIGMLNPGSSSSRYSLTPVFVSLARETKTGVKLYLDELLPGFNIPINSLLMSLDITLKE